MADPVNVSIVEHFQSLEDPRIERSRKHRLILTFPNYAFGVCSCGFLVCTL